MTRIDKRVIQAQTALKSVGKELLFFAANIQ